MSQGRLPNLLVAGVPKAGTGSLFAYLGQHPDICPSDTKEVGYFNFFDPRRHPGPPPPVDQYRKHFSHCGGERYAVEATPTYSYGGTPVIEGIRATLEDPRIIISLRDPVDRLWSAYTFQRELGNLTHLRSFEEYLDVCERRRRDGVDPVPHDHMHGLHIGFYAEYLPLWLDAFGANLNVVFAEDLARDASTVISGLFRWLDIDDAIASRLDLAPRNRTQHPRSTRLAKVAYAVKRSGDRLGVLTPAVRRPLRRLYARANSGRPPEAMSPETRRRVESLYRESNRRTAQALLRHGYRDLPSWLPTDARDDHRPLEREPGHSAT